MKLGQGNVMTGVRDSVHRGWGLPQCMLGYPPEQTPPPQSRPSPGADPLQEQSPPGADTPLGADTSLGADNPRSGPHPRKADSGIRSTSGRYASYWNAFLFVILFQSCSFFSSSCIDGGIPD